MHSPLSTVLKHKGSITHSIAPEASSYECALKLNKLGVGALLVMQANVVYGIVSERDFVRKLIGNKSDPEAVLVADIMTTQKDLITVPPTMTVREALQLITEKRIRHLPVIENGNLLGLISIGDLTKWIVSEQEHEIEALTGYIHGTTR